MEEEFNIECTINLHKKVHGTKFKKRASLSLNEIKKFSQKALGVKNVRIDSNLNKIVWKNGPKHVPFRIRVRLSK